MPQTTATCAVTGPTQTSALSLPLQCVVVGPDSAGAEALWEGGDNHCISVPATGRLAVDVEWGGCVAAAAQDAPLQAAAYTPAAPAAVMSTAGPAAAAAVAAGRREQAAPAAERRPEAEPAPAAAAPLPPAAVQEAGSAGLWVGVGLGLAALWVELVKYDPLGVIKGPGV